MLDIEKRVGEIALKEERAEPLRDPSGRQGNRYKPSGKPPKHERLGLTKKHMRQSQQIAKHPEIVERVKAQGSRKAEG